MKKEGSEGGWLLEWNKDQEIQDKESGETPESRTFRLIREEADRIVPGLEFSTDLLMSQQRWKVLNVRLEGMNREG